MNVVLKFSKTETLVSPDENTQKNDREKDGKGGKQFEQNSCYDLWRETWFIVSFLYFFSPELN